MAVLFLVTLPITGLTVYYPVYLHHLGFSPATVGGNLAAAGIAGAVGLFFGGPIAESLGRRPVLIAGAALMVASSLLLALSANPAALLVGAVAGGIGYTGSLAGGLFQSCFNPVLAGLADPIRRTDAMARAELAWASSSAVGALVAGLPSVLSGPLSDFTAWRTPFLATTLSASAGLCLLLGAHLGTPPSRSSGRPRLGAERRRVLMVAGIEVAHGAGAGILTLMPLWLALRFGLGNGQISLTYFAAQATGVVMLTMLPPIARRFGDRRSVIVLCVLDGAMLLVVAFSPWPWLAIVFLIGRYGVNSMFWAVQHSLIQGLVRPAVRATATSIILGGWTVGTGLSPAAAGVGLARGLLAPTLALAALLILSVALFWSRMLDPGTPAVPGVALRRQGNST